MPQDKDPNVPKKLVFQMSEMPEDNEPIAPKESAWERSRWGIASIILLILMIIGLFLVEYLWWKSFQPSPLSLPLYSVLSHILGYIYFGLFMGSSLSLILALIGLAKDQMKIYSILGIAILSILIGLAIWVLSKLSD